MPPKHNRRRNKGKDISGHAIVSESIRSPAPQITIPILETPPMSSTGPSRSVTVVRCNTDDSQDKKALSLLEAVATESLAFAANAPTSVQIQVSRLMSVIQKPVVDLLQLRAVVLSDGLPPTRYCAPSLRALVWKLLLGVIPAVRSEWMKQLEEKRTSYHQYVHDLIDEPEQVSELRFGVAKPPIREDGPIMRKPTTDHPLALVDSPSRWRRYWSDQEVFEQVNKDIYRTRPGVGFFSQAGDSRTSEVTPRGNAVTLSVLEIEKVVTSPKKCAFKVANIVSPKTHYDRMARILFLFAKLNFGYIQGMNEILAPIYYTLYHDVLEGHFVEADAFWALTVVMTEQRDIFCKNMDDSTMGMHGRLAVIHSLLAKQDPEVAEHLSKIGVKIDFFALRWIMLMFAQEFDMASIQVVWDAIFSDQNPASRLSGGTGSSLLSPVREALLVNYIAVAMIHKVRNALLDGDFSDVMRTLKQYPPFDPRDILAEAANMRKANYTSASIVSAGSTVELASMLAPELHNSPTSRSPMKHRVKGKKPSLATRFMNLVKRKT